MLQLSRRSSNSKPAGVPLAPTENSATRLRLHADVPEAEIHQGVPQLLGKIHNHSAVVGVVGLGYVGLPFAVEKAKVGYHVIGVELLADRADSVNRGDNYIPDVCDDDLRALVHKGQLEAVSDYARVDLRISAKTNEPYVLEINPNPYLENQSELAMAARDRGLSYTQLIGRIVESACSRYNLKLKERATGEGSPPAA